MAFGFLDLMQVESEGCTGDLWPLNSGGNPPASSTQLALYAVMIHAVEASDSAAELLIQCQQQWTARGSAPTQRRE